MAHVARSQFFAEPAAELWAAIGAFQSLADWHPAVATSTREDIGGVEHRRLALAGGGEIVEKHLGAEAASYAYEIVDGPLPVSGYRSSLTVVDVAGGCVAVWTSTFEPTAEGAENAVAGIYEAGFSALAARFGG